MLSVGSIISLTHVKAVIARLAHTAGDRMSRAVCCDTRGKGPPLLRVSQQTVCDIRSPAVSVGRAFGFYVRSGDSHPRSSGFVGLPESSGCAHLSDKYTEMSGVRAPHWAPPFCTIFGGVSQDGR
ncbi:hypothetical protein PGT21_011245 [Puccinia graminis f. sp. tritici]|uniref:Uncharacterized protein n=1 Tax=Puccinia graminis f. sp. tritici TaxID=56615 RepID=A0A5B0PRI7_PUCGR|nr:hypothetical protein PGT21_011245 [Puccinia graminis f. sp. tritici]